MKLLCLLLALFMVPAFPVQPAQDNMSATEYVTEHFDDFIAEYNNLDIEDCNATYIEFQKEINNFHGTGDVFDAVILAQYLLGNDHEYPEHKCCHH
jgi:pyridoxal/pyridoxine/pyridoxamine kinase